MTRIANRNRGKRVFFVAAVAALLIFSSISAYAFETTIASDMNWPIQFTELENLSGMPDYNVYSSEKPTDLHNIKNLIELPQP